MMIEKHGFLFVPVFSSRKRAVDGDRGVNAAVIMAGEAGGWWVVGTCGKRVRRVHNWKEAELWKEAGL